MINSGGRLRQGAVPYALGCGRATRRSGRASGRELTVALHEQQLCAYNVLILI
jgi:hypothetical protein